MGDFSVVSEYGMIVMTLQLAMLPNLLASGGTAIMGDERQERIEPLTEREREILRLIADGLTNQQIADQLFLTLDTVKWYNRQTYQKLGVRSRTQAVARARASGLLDKPARAVKHNLPAQSTVFIGRETELADIRKRLTDPACRLLTLVGPGGIGKTRLAIEAAWQQLEHFSDGVFFIPLASIESATFIAPALADALHLTQTSQQDPFVQVSNYLRTKTVLLVIDNFEHLLDSAQLLSELLDSSRQLKLLVTSRERLHLKDEWLFDVQGLRCPMPDQEEQSTDNLASYEAVQLFVQSAERVQSEFSLNSGDLDHVVHICQLVGGMPLGIELAASWVRALPCEAIAREIEIGLDILSTTLRDVPERHRSIRAVLDHSWAMLSATEQSVFCRLAVFSGSFQREAADAVAGASLSILLELLDKSFLQHVGPDRFAIHELLKQFGKAKLGTKDSLWLQTRIQHCRYFVAYLHERIKTPNSLQQVEEIEAEFDDIQSAWRFAVEAKQVNEIQVFSVDLWCYFCLRSWYQAGSDAIELYHQALALFETASKRPDRARTMAYLCDSLGGLYALKGAYDEAMQFYHQAIGHTDEGDSIGQGRILRQIGDVWVMMNKHTTAHAAYLEAELVLEAVEQRDTDWWTEWTHVQTERMWLYYWANRLEDMLELDRQIRSMIENHSLMTHRVRYLNALAMMSLRRERYLNSKDAIDYSGQALALSVDSGNLSEIAWSYFSHGFCHLWSKHLDEAEKHMLISQAMTEDNGDLSLLARSLTYLAVVYRKRHDIPRVRAYASYGLQVAETAQMPQYTGSALAQLAWLAWCKGDLVEAERAGRQAIETWGGLGIEQTVFSFRWLALFPLLGVALRRQELPEAMHYAQHLLYPPQQRLPDNLTRLVDTAVTAWEQGRSEVSQELLEQALELAHTMSYI